MLLFGKYEAQIPSDEYEYYLELIKSEWLNKTGYNGLICKDFNRYLEVVQFNFTLLTIDGEVKGFGSRKNTDRYYLIMKDNKLELFIDSNDTNLMESEHIRYDKDSDTFSFTKGLNCTLTKATQ